MSENLPDDLYKNLEKHFSEKESTGIPFGENYVYNALAYVEDVEDGDTWKAVRQPDPFVRMRAEYYRLDDVDTHETNADDPEKRKKAKEEKKFFEDFVKKGEQDWDKEWPFVIVFTDPTDKKKDYSGTEFEGTYGRPIADMIRRSDGRSLIQAFLDEFGDSIKPK